MTADRLSPALAVLRAELNAAHPHRDRSSDGWIGDAAHRNRASDHNPDEDGSVNALDIDRDGIAVARLLDVARDDGRTSYVIYSGLIYSRANGFKPSKYTGANPHNHHVHVSIRHGRQVEDDTRPWGYLVRRAPKPTAPPTPQEESDMGLQFRNNEAGPGYGAVIYAQGGKGVNLSGADHDAYTAAGVRVVQLTREGFLSAQARYMA